MKNIALLYITILLSLLFTSCSTKGKKDQTIKLAFVAGAATDFWTFAERGTEKADQELEDVEVEFRYTSGGAAVEQRRIIDDLLAKGINGLAVTPLDPKNQTPIINYAADQVPVVITDSDAPGSKRLCYIGTNNVSAGREAGKLILEVLPDGGKIMLFVGRKDAQNAKERIQGVNEELKGSNIEIIDIRTDDIDRVRAKANANDALVKYPDLDCLVGLWSYNGPMILSALRDAEKLGKVNIVSFDEENETIEGVKDGYIYGSVVQQPFEFGYQAIKVLSEVIKGNNSVIPPNKQIIIPTRVIKQENAAAFLEQIKSLRKTQ